MCVAPDEAGFSNYPCSSLLTAAAPSQEQERIA